VRSRFNIREESTKSRRAYEYVNRTVYLQKYAGEMRMTGIFNVMRRTYEEGFKQIMETIKKHESVQIFVGWSGCLLAYVFNFFGMWLLASYLALGSKTINAADFIVLAAAISSASNLLGSMGSEYRNSVEDSIFVESLRESMIFILTFSELCFNTTPFFV
jgi:ATP-binding cassette subfamily B protein